MKTSNSSLGELKHQEIEGEKWVSYDEESLFQLVVKLGKIGILIDRSGRRVTYSQRLLGLRKLFAYLFFLICGYAAQGATAKNEVPAFDTNGLKAVVNSSRAVFTLGRIVHFDKENMKKRRVKKQLGWAIVS